MMPYEEDEYRDYDPDWYDPDIYTSDEQARDVWESVQEYFHDKGYSNEQWMSMIQEIQNVYYDDEGSIHFDFDWYDGDAEYGGHGSI